MPPQPTCRCGTCKKCRGRRYAATYRERKPGMDRAWAIENRERVNELARARRARGSAEEARRVAVRARVYRAVKAGKLERGACEVCGASPAQAHHDDYAKPLEVRWLCPQHHTDEHMEEAASPPIATN